MGAVHQHHITSVMNEDHCTPSPLSVALHRGKSPHSLSRAVNQEITWVDDPDYVEENVVSPVIIGLWSRVLDPLAHKFKGTCTKVKDVAVYLAQADDGLERVAERMVIDDAPGADKREWTPEDCRYGLHAHHKDV